MRIIHLSDIHLSYENLPNLKNFYLEALITDLHKFNTPIKIDLIIVTGDLLDKGGESFKNRDGYKIFKEEFLIPIMNRIGISKERILFIPGNHDVENNKVKERSETYLLSINKEKANLIIKDNLVSFNDDNKRLEEFKLFEHEFHEGDTDYYFSNNESSFIYNEGTENIGFALINDSWRCSKGLAKENHFIGYNQLFNALERFKLYNTEFNIAVFHHPLESFNNDESEEIENILKTKNFKLLIFGHKHEYKSYSLVSPSGEYLSVQGRSAFNDSSETNSIYQPGYSVIDIDILRKEYTLNARKFIKKGFRFDADVDSIPEGLDKGSLFKSPNVSVSSEPQNPNRELPSAYSVNLERIVKLLIGRSLYSNPYVFVRELIQNAVDACDRKKINDSYSNPKIRVVINSSENSFEIIDDGDGMTKKVLREHFSVIGKSISQEYNNSTGNFALISKFGIGFISTFIVAQRVLISTKSELDEQITFSINNVFRNFIYSKDEELLLNDSQTGTKIKVYLKKEYNASHLVSICTNYCRHISNFEVSHNKNTYITQNDWNINDSNFQYEVEDSQYKLVLGIGIIPKYIITTNSGFLINTFSPQVHPYKFPSIIGGEINFKPGAIDFDISRSNIMETDKSLSAKKTISLSIKPLFRQALDSNNDNLKSTVLDYLQYYLTVIDQEYKSFESTHTYFYTKGEICDLLYKYLNFLYRGFSSNLIDIVVELKARGINSIYYYDKNTRNDYELIIAKYLIDNNYLVIHPNQINVQCVNVGFQISTATAMEILCRQLKLTYKSVSEVDPIIVSNIKMDKTTLPQIIFQSIKYIESNESIIIEIASFDKNSIPFIQYRNEYYINYLSFAFHNIVKESKSLRLEQVNVYIYGLLGLNISNLISSYPPTGDLN